MHETRITEWLKSLEGIASALGMVGATFASIYATVEGKLTPAARGLGFEAGTALAAARVAALLLLVPVLWFVVRSYHRFARASRLEQPDRFTLSASTPESLIGRAEDLASLLNSVAKNRLVLLDGESGCGKSALVAAGVVPRLLSGTGPLPVLICDWGDDWVRGPLATALGALFEVLTPEQRATLGWTQPPDLAADASALAAELGKRFAGVAAQLGRRPLLITDQFDDYQARYRERFIDANGNWLKPDALASANPFWALTRSQLQAGALHLLVVTRADTASGLSCVRFLDSAMTADRHLPRVELEYLRPLLEGIAPADAVPVVVSQPDQGWYELRDRLEADLRLQGAVLMQQVRTVLLGLRQLPCLNTTAYRRAGGLRGAESLVIARAIRRAGDAANGSEATRTLVRRMLGALVLPGGANQAAKAQRTSFADLVQLVGDDTTARKILQTLQAEDVVRPADGPGGRTAWQLDHDYLAHAVQTEARQADRWGIALREGLEQYRMAGDAWRRRWTALLPINLQVRLVWERIRGRLRYGEATGYARCSLLKPALGALLLSSSLTAAYLWNEDRMLSLAATRIYDRFGGANEAAAVLEAWQAPKATRDRLYRLVQEDSDRLERATRSAWPQAHGSLEAGPLLQSARMLHERLAQETGFFNTHGVEQAYTTVVTKLTDPSAIAQEAATLRERLVSETHPNIVSNLAEVYATVIAKLTDPSAIMQEAAALHERLKRETDPHIASNLAEAYATVVAKLTDPSAIAKAASTLREHLAHEGSPFGFNWVQAYATVAARLTDPSTIAQETAALREHLERETDARIAPRFAKAYAIVAAKLTDPSDIAQATAALRERLTRAPFFMSSRLAQAYATVMVKLTDPSDIAQATATLRERLARETDSNTLFDVAQAYATVAAKLTDPSAIAQEAAALRERLVRETDPDNVPYWAQAYTSVAAKLTEPSILAKEAAALRERLVRETDPDNVSYWAQAYTSVAAKLTEPSIIAKEAAALRERLVRETDPNNTPNWAQAYATVAAKLTDPSAIAREATALRERLVRETNARIASQLAKAYSIVAAKLTDPAAITQEAAALRERLVRETDPNNTPNWAQAYATVAAKLTDPSTIAREAASLRERLVRATSSGIAYNFALAYAAVAKKIVADAVSRADRPTVATQVSEVLIMAGHPYLNDAKGLLSAVEPASRRDFGSDVGAAVEWWVKEFRGDPATLRPPLAGVR